MPSKPTQQHLVEALKSAAKAHHEYEKNYLNGVRDEQWAGWYSAFILGRTGDFTTPTQLTRWLEEVSGNEWVKDAAIHILTKIK